MTSEVRTIVAVTTPPGEGGIGVVEVHGPLAERAVLRHFHCSTDFLKLRKLYHGMFRDTQGRPLDEVLIHHVPSSESLTGLDCVEVHCHGGPVPVRAVLDAVVAEGVVETSWKGLILEAFRGGRIDATRAEAGFRLPGASTPLAAGMLHDQWEGALARAADTARDRAAVETLRATARTGIALVRSLTVVIAGPPNAGKSTLFNALLDDIRAVVHHEPGTTRDPVRGMMSIDGIPFTLVDTAGLGAPVGPLDRLAQERGTEALRKADVVLGVVEMGEDDCRAMEEIQRLAGNRPFIGVLNKVDRGGDSGIGDGIFRVSALKKAGLDPLRRAVVRAAAVDPASVRTRHEITAPSPRLRRDNGLRRGGQVAHSPEASMAQSAMVILWRALTPGVAVLFTERQEKILDQALERIGDEGWHERMVRRLAREWNPET